MSYFFLRFVQAPGIAVSLHLIDCPVGNRVTFIFTQSLAQTAHDLARTNESVGNRKPERIAARTGLKLAS